jgi:hypothetical protein
MTALPPARSEAEELHLYAGDAIGISDAGRWAKEEGVDQTEHRGVGADAKGQGQDGDEREAGRSAEPAGGVAEIVEEGGRGPYDPWARAGCPSVINGIATMTLSCRRLIVAAAAPRDPRASQPEFLTIGACAIE